MNHTILFVDDDPEALLAVAKVFEGTDYVDRVLAASGPEQAMRHLAREPVAALITDQKLATMSGTEFLARVLEAYPDVVRVMLTGTREASDIIDAINRGHVYAFVGKPWAADELRLVMRRALEHHDVTEELRRKNRELASAYQQLAQAHREQGRRYELVITDPETGARNFHFFAVRLSEEYERARRYKHDLSLVMVDLDDFHEINDRHGQQIGDQVLAEIARVLGEGRRGVDVVARYGGEEFALILPETGAEGAGVITERVRERIASMTFAGDIAVHMTISAGISTFPGAGGRSREELVDGADRALYAAKARGKNRVEHDNSDLKATPAA